MNTLATITGSAGKRKKLGPYKPERQRVVGVGRGWPASSWASWGFRSWGSGPRRRVAATSRTRYS
jgi:hypothetical protein